MISNVAAAARPAADAAAGAYRDLAGIAVAIGGTATAGPAVGACNAAGGEGAAEPYPEALERICRVPIANLGRRHAGLDAMLADDAALAQARGARVRLVEIPGASAQTTAFWRVHPRRNDRLLAPGPALRALYPEVDLAGVCFVGDLVQMLARHDQARLATLARGLRGAWVHKMRALLAAAGGQAVLVAAGPAPLVTPAMIAALGPAVADVIAWPADAARVVQALQMAAGQGRLRAVAPASGKVRCPI